MAGLIKDLKTLAETLFTKPTEPLVRPQRGKASKKKQTWEDIVKLSEQLNAPIGKHRYKEFNKPTPTPPDSFGIGTEEAFIEPNLFDVLISMSATPEERRLIAELSGQESSYGYAGPHITEKEESYGPVHINLKAGRKNPQTGEAFTKEGATDIETAINYALEEMRRTGGLGMWNPIGGEPNPFYQYDIPERSKTKLYRRGE